MLRPYLPLPGYTTGKRLFQPARRVCHYGGATHPPGFPAGDIIGRAGAGAGGEAGEVGGGGI